MSTSAYISHICPLASFACTPRSKALSFQLRVSTHSPLHSSLRCRRPPPMSSDYAGTNFPANKLEPIQLNDESDFYQITSPDGFISISGFGSLLSGTCNWQIAISIIIDDLFFFSFWKYAIRCVLRAENSARSTFPNLINFRVAKLSGFRRVFAHVAPIFFERGIAKPETKVTLNLTRVAFFSPICYNLFVCWRNYIRLKVWNEFRRFRAWVWNHVKERHWLLLFLKLKNQRYKIGRSMYYELLIFGFRFWMFKESDTEFVVNLYKVRFRHSSNESMSFVF